VQFLSILTPFLLYCAFNRFWLVCTLQCSCHEQHNIGLHTIQQTSIQSNGHVWPVLRAFTLAIRPCKKNLKLKPGFYILKNPKPEFWQRAPALQTQSQPQPGRTEFLGPLNIVQDHSRPYCYQFLFLTRCGVVVSALASINEVNLRRARLVLRWATVSGFNSPCRTCM